MRVGYVRCSTAEQNEARQLKMMEEQKVEKIFIDKASGKNTDRKATDSIRDFYQLEGGGMDGSVQMLRSAHHRELTELFHALCAKHGILHDNDRIFRWLSRLEDADQMTLFHQEAI